MTTEDKLAKYFAENQLTWNLKEGEPIVPEKDDFEEALDEAARILYNEPVGAQLQVGRLIIIKRHYGHDVYVYVGDYL